MSKWQQLFRKCFGVEGASLPAYVTEGRTRSSGHPLRLLSLHEPCAFLTYLKSTALRPDFNEHKIDNIRPWHARKVARRLDCDFLFIFGWANRQNPIFFRNYFFIPQWISGKAEIDYHAVYTGKTSSRRRAIRLLEEGPFHYRVTRDPSDLSHFYTEMYIPTIRHAHGDAAVLMSFEEAKRGILGGTAELIYISDNSQPLAGSLIVYESDRPRLLSMGVLNADKDLFRSGISAAIYLFSFQHLVEAGFKEVDIGRTRPFLNDGTLYFKRRFGLAVTSGTDHGFFFTCVKNNEAVRDFLCNNPFIYSYQRSLKGVVFYQNDEESKEVDSYEVPGLSSFVKIDISRTQVISPQGLQ